MVAAGEMCLEDFERPGTKWLVDAASLGTPEPAARPAPAQLPDAPQGYCSRRHLGLVRRRYSLICVFTDGTSLRLALLGRVHNLTDPETVGRVRRPAPPIDWLRQFALTRRDTTLVTFRYWYAEPEDYWPECDILTLVERVTQSGQSRAGFLRAWNDIASGGSGGLLAGTGQRRRE
jgi:hypothetical protein